MGNLHTVIPMVSNYINHQVITSWRMCSVGIYVKPVQVGCLYNDSVDELHTIKVNILAILKQEKLLN